MFGLVSSKGPNTEPAGSHRAALGRRTASPKHPRLSAERKRTRFSA